MGSYKVIKSIDQTKKRWSGGTTNQLYIYPKGSKYEDRDFTFRISSAVVEDEESTFTSLEGFSRVIMLLDGDLEIIHEGRYQKKLELFGKDVFSGGWNTRSIGKATDFNLMTSSQAEGDIVHMALLKGDRCEMEISKDMDYEFLYVHSGRIRIRNLSFEEIIIEAGDFVEIDAKAIVGTIELMNGSDDDANIIRTMVKVK